MDYVQTQALTAGFLAEVEYYGLQLSYNIQQEASKVRVEHHIKRYMEQVEKSRLTYIARLDD